jgi:hypothetical protein
MKQSSRVPQPPSRQKTLSGRRLLPLTMRCPNLSKTTLSLLGSRQHSRKISPFLIHGGSRAHDTLHLPASRRSCCSCAWPPAGRGGRASPAPGAVRQASGFAAGAQRDHQPQAGAWLAVRHRRRLIAHPSQASTTSILGSRWRHWSGASVVQMFDAIFQKKKKTNV